LVSKVEIFGLERIPLVKPGDDIAQLIFDAARSQKIKPADGDVVVVSHKIISKAEGLLVDISCVTPGQRARSISRRTRKDPRLVELILRDSNEVLRASPQALVVRRKDGFLCLNAGVDKSNVDGRLIYCRLPDDSDLSANNIRVRLEQLSGRRLGVIVADTYSRPLRFGQVEFAIGISGFEPLFDYRGSEDIFGYKLRYKLVGLADEVAAAAELVMGQGREQIPVAIVRGLTRIRHSQERGLSRGLLLGRRMDLFRKIL